MEPTAPSSTTENTRDKIRVMLVDDSAVIRGLISRALQKDPVVEIVSSVHNGRVAVDSVKRAAPDVVVLDIEMPEMDGLTALPLILEQKPDTKVLICSTLSAKGAAISMQALALGATECLAKPSSTSEINSASAFQDDLLRLIRALGPKIGITTVPSGIPSPATASRPATVTTAMPFTSSDIQLHDDRFSYKGKPDILAIGSSTGGPQALFEVIKNFKDFDIPIVVTQHMPKTFTAMLAKHIEQNCGLPCHEGAQGMSLEPGTVYVAPGGYHMLFKQQNGKTVIDVNDGPQENFCKPAVDPMMRSLIDIYGKKILAVILTGMGYDGKKGCQKLVEAGGRVIAQDEKTSTVWGMPGAVATAGICSAVLPVDKLGPWARDAVMKRI
ncbi:MAG: chemotaxis response regulator protein-glutamate methylesterase [Rhodospirillales bacterium]|nr:chemotaxis response regulator protein-glutamate methylesterase [Rhodospirillales bacterium]